MTTVFSYRRFSSKKQEQGDSLRRQTKLAEAYAAEQGWFIDERSFEDLGLSAFTGRNLREGALGAFLKAVDDGKIPSNSTLMVESLDRVSRAEILDALELFTSIINRGITLVTILDRQHYSRESVRQNWTQLILSIATMARAHEESLTKSNRIRAALAKSRASGIKGGKVPKWLRLNEDRKSFTVIEHEANIVQKAFELRASGIGSHRIAKQLMSVFSIVTSTPQVAALLKNPAVIGTKVSQAGYEPVLGYYEPIITKSLFYQVQDALGAPKSARVGRRPNDEPNLFSGLARCLLCGSSMRFYRESKTVSQRYLVCSNAVFGRGCTASHVNYGAFEQEMIGWLLMDQDDEVIPLFERPTVKRAEEPSAELFALREQKERLLKLFAAGTLKNTDDVSRLLNDLDQQIKTLTEQLQTISVESQDRLPAEKAWSLAVLHEERSFDDDKTAYYEVRREIKAAFSRAIREIQIAPEERVGDEVRGLVRVLFHGYIDGVERSYVRPALQNVRGRLIGSRRWKAETN